MMRNTLFTMVLVGIATVAFVVSCGGSASQVVDDRTNSQSLPTAAASTDESKSEMKAMCPMKVEGVAVTAEQSSDGIALAFRTDTGSVAELRKRVQHMESMHSKHHSDGGKHGHMHDKKHDKQGGPMMGKKMMGEQEMVPAATRVEEIEGGAQLVLTPKDSNQLEKLRAHVRHKAERMASGECSMMMGDMPSGQSEVSQGEESSNKTEEHRSHH